MVVPKQLIMNPANTVRFILIQPASGKTVNVQPRRTLNWKYWKQRKSIRSKLLKEQVKNDNNSASFCRGEDIKFLQVICETQILKGKRIKICKSNNPAKGGGLNTSQMDLGFHTSDLQENKKAGDFHRRLFY
jgi:hypothetical protein